MSSKVRRWYKVAELLEEPIPANARVKPSPYLEFRAGARKASFRVNFRQGDISLREVISGEFYSIEDWKYAQRLMEQLIAKSKAGIKQEPASQLRCEQIAEQLIAESQDQDASTIDGKQRILRKHLIPWLNDNGYSRAADLSIATWPKYKNYKRSVDPTIALENHVKYFRMLRKRAYELGAIRQCFQVKFELKKEEYREEGMVIPKADLESMITAANYRKSVNKDGSPSHGQGNRVWHDRMIIQSDTGMRPGEVRKLRKTAVTIKKRGKEIELLPNVQFEMRKDPETGIEKRIAIIRLYPEDVKTHRFRDFEVYTQRTVEVLWERSQRHLESPYYFPMETDPSRPMDKKLNGWYSALARAKVEPDYTPHDLRHTYADEMFKKTGPEQWASLCYQLDMSLETARKVYIHFKVSDTRGVALLVEKERAAILAEGAK